jgi:hypothetical protein
MSIVRDEDFPSYVINAIADKLGYNEDPKYLGSGYFGIAYSVADKVLKITTDSTEANIANKTRKQSPTNHFVNYYDVRPLKYKEYNNLYVLVMDKVKALPSEISNIELTNGNSNQISIATLLHSFLEPRDFNSPFYRNVMNNPESKNIIQSNPLLTKIIKQFPEIRKEYQTAPYSLDLHNRNLGIDANDNLQIFDQGSKNHINRVRLNKGIVV